MEERIESQRKRIMDYLNGGNSITSLEALMKFGAFRLSAIIYVLKNDYGMPIETEMVYEEHGKRYAKYSLAKECLSEEDFFFGDIVYVKFVNEDASQGLVTERLFLFKWWDCERDGERSFVTKKYLDLKDDVMVDCPDCPVIRLDEKVLCFRKANEEELKLWKEKR